MLCLDTTAKRRDTLALPDSKMGSFSQQQKRPDSRSSSLWIKGSNTSRNLLTRKLAVIILAAKSNRLKDLLPLASICLARFKSLEPGKVIRVQAPSQ